MTTTDTPTLHPLIARLVERHGAPLVSLATLDDFLARPGDQALFFTGDPVRFPECVDVAVVLPELQAATGHRFGVGVVSPTDEDAIARRYGSRHWPALVFVRDGRYVATIPGLRDWQDYVVDVGTALATPPSRAPTIGIPVVGDGSGAAGCAA